MSAVVAIWTNPPWIRDKNANLGVVSIRLACFHAVESIGVWMRSSSQFLQKSIGSTFDNRPLISRLFFVLAPRSKDRPHFFCEDTTASGERMACAQSRAFPDKRFAAQHLIYGHKTENAVFKSNVEAIERETEEESSKAFRNASRATDAHRS